MGESFKLSEDAGNGNGFKRLATPPTQCVKIVTPAQPPSHLRN